MKLIQRQMNVKGAHFLEGGIAAFDAPFFSINPAEAASMDPLMDVSYTATGTEISMLANRLS